MKAVRQRVSIVVVAVLMLSAACASVPKKDQAVRGVEALHAVLAAAQDAEMSLYAAGTVPALTEAKHKAFHAQLSKAFDAEIRLATALRTWRAGDPPPASAAEVLATAKEALTVVADLTPQAGSVIAAVQSWLDTAAQIQAIFQGGAQ